MRVKTTPSGPNTGAVTERNSHCPTLSIALGLNVDEMSRITARRSEISTPGSPSLILLLTWSNLSAFSCPKETA